MHNCSLSKDPFPKKLRLSLLYVDDSHQMLDIIKFFFEKDSLIDIKTCFCPRTAFQLIQKNNQDLVISDYDMPEMNGIELLYKIRSEGIRVPFILYTSYNREEIDEKIFKMDSVYYIPKSGSIEQEVFQIKSVIQNLCMNQNNNYPIHSSVDIPIRL